MNKKIPIIMLIMCILIIIILIILTLLLNIQDNNPSQIEEQYATDQDVKMNYELTKVNSKYEFYDIQNCIDKYINTLKSLDKAKYDNGYDSPEVLQEIEETLQEQREILYALLGKEYKEQFKININNIDERFSKYYKETIFNIENMSVLDINEDISIYVIDGQIQYNNNIENYEFIIKKDASNLTFAVYPQDYIKAMGDLNAAVESIKNNNNIEIENKQYNTYTSQAYDDEYIASYYFNIYKNNIISNPEYIYNKLEKEYREKRFGTLQEFKNYVNENQNEIIRRQFAQYLVQENENSIEYVCKDQYDNLYIFKQLNLQEYSLTLDTYTLEQEKFNIEYQKATNQKKVMMNIDKFFQMINAKDYKAAYSLLNDEFKNKNFRTEEQFKKYIIENLFTYNDIKYINYSDEISSIFTYDIMITNKLKNTEKANIKIIMQLKEGTDFVMSFSMN